MIYKDEWLSKQISKSAYQLKSNNILKINFSQEWKDFKNKQKDKDFFVFSKISTDAVNIWHYLEKADFKLIDTNVKFEFHGILPNIRKNSKDIDICFAQKKDQTAVGKIAKNNFIYSRFHLDPMIGNNIANQLKQRWVENYFLGNRGDEMVLALLNNEPVGFLQLRIKINELFIDLIGVDKKAQGNGIASAMIQFASQNIKHSLIKVGTQIGNIPSIKLYQKLNFLFNSIINNNNRSSNSHRIPFRASARVIYKMNL